MKTITFLFAVLFAANLISSISVSGQQTTIPITAVSFPKEVIHLDGGAIDFYAKLSGFDGVIPYGGGEPYFFAQRDSLGFPWQMGFNSNDGLANGGLTGFGSHGHIPYTGYNTGTGYYCNNCWTYAQVLGHGQVDQWHHYRIEWDKDGVSPFNGTTRRMAIYVDGVLNSQRWDPMPLGEDVNEIVGGTLNLISTGNPGKGTLPGLVAIDEFKVYDRNGNLLLWNSLGSETEVVNSIVGPDGSYNRGGNAHFVTGIVGKAVEANPVSGFGYTCNGLTVYKDADGDAYGNPSNSLFVADCKAPQGYVYDNTDCNDANASIHPSAKEICNGIDDNCNGVIDEISGLKTTNITATTATFNWKALPGSKAYFIKYRWLDPSGKTLKAGVSAPAFSISISGLRPNSIYAWEIKSYCDGLNTPYSGPVRFKTAAALSASEQEDESIKAAGIVLSVYPNPGNGNMTISISLPKPQAVLISVSDVAGKEVYASKEGIVSGTFTRQIDLSKLNPGTYFLKLTHDEKSEVKKIVIKK